MAPALPGAAAWRKLSEAFYARVKRDPLLRPLFPGKTLHCAIEEFTAFLVQLFDGPSEDSQRRWWLSLRESHRRFRIGPQERAAWMNNMAAALEEAGIEEPLRDALWGFLEQSSAHVIGVEPPSVEPPADPLRKQMSHCWDAQLALDETVAAIRRGDAARAIALAPFQRDRSVFAGLLALMMGSRHTDMLRFVEQELAARPALVRERYAGRTLLHAAASQGNLAMVESLLRLGANVDEKDGGGHTALYSAANECQSKDAAGVVRALARAGANINADDGVKRCTALHMAARRGNLSAAEALLDSGAEIDARDSVGETPLRRAVNCNKAEVAALLLARGADRHSIGSKGLTPLRAARSAAMKHLLNK